LGYLDSLIERLRPELKEKEESKKVEKDLWKIANIGRKAELKPNFWQ
jgi:CRISPR/Cas system-associated protein Cas5 (RAMP superfamily)